MTPCRLLSRYQHFGRASSLLLSGSPRTRLLTLLGPTSEKSVLMHKSTWRQIPGDGRLQQHRCVNLGSLSFSLRKRLHKSLSAPPPAIIFSILKWNTFGSRNNNSCQYWALFSKLHEKKFCSCVEAPQHEDARRSENYWIYIITRDKLEAQQVCQLRRRFGGPVSDTMMSEIYYFCQESNPDFQSPVSHKIE